MLNAVITDSDFYGGEPRQLGDVSRYAARGIVLDEQNRAGLILMSANGFYKLPGGGIDLGERENDAFLREVLEETGYKCEIIAPLGTVVEHKYKRNFCQYSYAFVARRVGEQQVIKLTANEKMLGFSMNWMSLEDASALMANSLEMAQEYGMKFMLRREKLIIDYAISLIDSGELTL